MVASPLILLEESGFQEAVKTQSAAACIQKTDLTSTQPAVASIQKDGLTKTQTATASIQKTGRTKTQTATAKIYVAGVVDVVLDSPDNAATVRDATPTLSFTGTNSDSDPVEYWLQIDTANTFNSTPGGWPLITKYSDGAINYRGIGTYVSANSSSAVVPAPAGLADGDLVFVIIRRAAEVNPSSAPVGWSLLQSVLSTYGFWIYYKVAQSEGSSWTWSWAANTKTLAYAHAFYGDYDLNNPIQSSTMPYSATASGMTINIPTLTTSVDNTMSLIISSGYSTSSKSFTVPTSPAYTERSDTGSATPDFWQAIATYVYPTVNTATGTISYPAGANCTYRIGCQVLINPNTYTGFQAGHPFTSGSQVTYTSSIPLANNTYYWRLCAKDPADRNIYGSWSATRSVIIEAGAKVWSGGSWSYKPIKVWTGSQWEVKPIKVWNGSQWVQKG